MVKRVDLKLFYSSRVTCVSAQDVSPVNASPRVSSNFDIFHLSLYSLMTSMDCRVLGSIPEKRSLFVDQLWPFFT